MSSRNSCEISSALRPQMPVFSHLLSGIYLPQPLEAAFLFVVLDPPLEFQFLHFLKGPLGIKHPDF